MGPSIQEMMPLQFQIQSR